jgi:Fur family ferric uptake transcriptional regulator
VTDAPDPSAPPRRTRQRAAVAAALDEADGFRSAQSLHVLLRERGDTVSLTTVYRTLAAMADAHEVDVLVGEDGEARYRRCSDGHHHHLVCRDCGRTVEVEGPAVEEWAHRTAQAHDFADISHTLEIFGRCGACSRRAATP